MRKETKQIIAAATITVAGIYAFNKIYTSVVTSKKLLDKSEGKFYDFEHGKVFYTKTGNGEPLLLVHDTDPSASSCEWSKIINKLSYNHTVYTIDLLGCGRSEKPNFSYTNYMYTQLIQSFIKDVIKEKTSIVATNFSASFVLMANQLTPDIFDKVILINPVSVTKMDVTTDEVAKCKKNLFQVPILGSFVYNIMMSPLHLKKDIQTTYINKPQYIPAQMTDTYLESSHLDDNKGKFLLASILGNFMNINMKHVVKNLETNVSIIATKDMPENKKIVKEYQKLNNNFDITLISGGKLYPQLEVPEKVASVIQQITEN